MEQLKLFDLLTKVAGVKPLPPTPLGPIVRRLLQSVRQQDGRPIRQNFFSPGKAQSRAGKEWSKRQLVHTNYTCDPKIYIHRPCFREVPVGKNEREQFVLDLVDQARMENVRGNLVSAASLAEEIIGHYLFGDDPAFDALVRMACDQLRTDLGTSVVDSLDRAEVGTAADWVLSRQREVTKQYVAQQNRVGKAMAMCSEAFMMRTRAFLEPRGGVVNTNTLRDALTMANLARDTVWDFSTPADRLIKAITLYLRTRTIVDAWERLDGIQDDFRTMIDLAEELADRRIWTDVLRTMTSYFIRAGQPDEALECLGYLADLVDRLDPVSIFTQSSVLERMIGWALLAKRNPQRFIKAFVCLLEQHRILYFKQRFELSFGRLDNFVDTRGLNAVQSWVVASRCANFRFFPELLK